MMKRAFLSIGLKTISSILNLQRWAIKVMTGSAPGSLLSSTEQHEAIFNAIKAGQPDAAAQAVKTHIEMVFSAYRQEVRRRLLTDDISEQRKEQ